MKASFARKLKKLSMASLSSSSSVLSRSSTTRTRTTTSTSARPQQGVALVITLVLLSVITFMAVTFLVVSRREREQVTNVLRNQRDATFAANEALQQSKAQIVAHMELADDNGYERRPLGFHQLRAVWIPTDSMPPAPRAVRLPMSATTIPMATGSPVGGQ